MLLDKERHSARHQLNKAVILYLRRHKLASPHALNQSWTAQWENVMTALRTDNQELAAFVTWAMDEVHAYETKHPGMSIDMVQILNWESYVWHMKRN